MTTTQKEETGLKGCYVLIPKRFGDDRGYYTSQFVAKDLKGLGIPTNRIEQEAESKSVKGTIRGMHYQLDPLCQAKFVKCNQGALYDVVVDLRIDSPTYKKWFGVVLTPENGKMLYVPRGFAHGFMSLEDNTRLQYLVDNHYSPSHEGGIAWDDPEIGIEWPLEEYGITEPILSEKDANRPTAEEAKPQFYMEKRVMVTGCKGQLGYDVVRELNDKGIYNVLVLDIDDLDITDRDAVRKTMLEYRPDCVIHCAAYTAVDKAEENVQLAININENGTKNIADMCKELDATLVYISTDYVFDGKKKEYDTYTPADEPNPLSIYGKTKYQGELYALENQKTFVLRTAWVFGINGNNFVKTMLNLSEKYSEIKVVDDQIGSPTYTVDLAKVIVDMIDTNRYGIYHVTNEGFCSWAEFADYILKDTNTKVIPVTTEEYYKPKYEEAEKTGNKLYIAERPMISKLSKVKLFRNGFGTMPKWQDAVDRYMEELNQQKVLKKEM